MGQKVFFDFKGSFLNFVFEFGIFWSKAKLIFGQFRAILLLGPSKSGRSLWVKKWISFFSTGVTEKKKKGGGGVGKLRSNCLILTRNRCTMLKLC